MNNLTSASRERIKAYFLVFSICLAVLLIRQVVDFGSFENQMRLLFAIFLAIGIGIIFLVGLLAKKAFKTAVSRLPEGAQEQIVAPGRFAHRQRRNILGIVVIFVLVFFGSFLFLASQ